MPQTILIADDEPFMLDMIEAKLARSGYHTVRANDGDEALAMLEHGADAAVIDAMMPTKDGFELLESIRANPKTEAMPVIMLTALRQDAHILRALRLGADDFLTKPF